jgi:hypothetical protein
VVHRETQREVREDMGDMGWYWDIRKGSGTSWGTRREKMGHGREVYGNFDWGISDGYGDMLGYPVKYMDVTEGSRAMLGYPLYILFSVTFLLVSSASSCNWCSLSLSFSLYLSLSLFLSLSFSLSLFLSLSISLSFSLSVYLSLSLSLFHDRNGFIFLSASQRPGLTLALNR